jgi:hypothetical protein
MKVIDCFNLEEGVVIKSNRGLRSQLAFTRGQRVRELKEQGYSKKEILKEGFTAEEYSKYKGKSIQFLSRELMRETTSIMNEYVG